MKDKTPKLSAADYWEWRCTIEERKVAKVNEKRVHLEREIMHKEIENRKLKLALFKETVRAAQLSVEDSDAEYEKIKQRLEKKLGISLDNKAIDPYSFEIKEI